MQAALRESAAREGGGGRGNSLFKPYKINLEHRAGNALRSLSATRSSPSRSSNPRATRLRTLPSPLRQRTRTSAHKECTAPAVNTLTHIITEMRFLRARSPRPSPETPIAQHHLTPQPLRPATTGTLPAHQSATCIVKRCAHRNRPLTSQVPRAEARPSAPRELSRPDAATHRAACHLRTPKIFLTHLPFSFPHAVEGKREVAVCEGRGDWRERRGLKFVNSAQPQRAVFRLRQ